MTDIEKAIGHPGKAAEAMIRILGKSEETKLYYFVSYAYARGFGRCQISIDTAISKMEHVFAIEKYIAETFHVESPLIVNWQCLYAEGFKDDPS